MKLTDLHTAIFFFFPFFFPLPPSAPKPSIFVRRFTHPSFPPPSCIYLVPVTMPDISFGSVGDIISVCLLAKEILLCIDEARGSVTEYRSLSDELRCLEKALLEAALMIENHRQKIGSSFLAESIREEITNSKSCLERFRATMSSKYDGAFRTHSPAGPLVRLSKSLQWRLTEKDAIIKFRDQVSVRFNALSMLIVTANV